MAKVGSKLDQDVTTAGYDQDLYRGFESRSGSDMELQEATGFSYAELQDLLAGGTPSSFVTSIVFTSDDEDTISWSSGSINYQSGTKFTTASGTANISARTYIYFNPNISPTTLQTSTVLGDAVTDGGLLLAIAIPNADTDGKAEIFTIGATGAYPAAMSTSHLEAGVMTVPLVITPASDTTALVAISQNDGSRIFTIDSTNLRSGFGIETPAKFLDINANSNTQLIRLYGLDEALTETHFPDTQTQIVGSWSGLANVEASDDLRATSNNQFDVEVDLTDFGFVSVGGTIVGIEVLVEARNTSGGSRHLDITLSGDAGSTFSDEKSSSALTASDVNYTFGGASDLWGYTWTPAKFSNANFKMKLVSDYVSGTATTQIDYVQVTVYYTSGVGVSTTQLVDIFVGTGGSLVFDLTPGTSSTQFFDFRPEDNEYGLVLRESDGTGTTALANFYVVDGTPDYLSINVTGTTTTSALNITSGNDVGIGTAAPGGKLHVKGSNTTGIRIEGAATNELADLYVAVDGNLVISTTAGSDTAGFIDIRPEDNEYGLILRESDGTGTAVFANFYVVDAATDYMSITISAVTATTGIIIDANHQLGVGVTPTSKLHVNGSVTIGTSAAGVDYSITFDGETNNGILTWMEDEDYFRFSDDIHMLDQEAIYFDSTDTYIAANADDPEDLVIAADQDILLEPDNRVIANSGVTIVGNLFGTPDAITATSEGVAAALTTINTEVTTNGDMDLDNVTLAAGTTGQIKNIYCVVLGNVLDTWKITPAVMVGGTQITFTGVGQGATLVYADNEGWIIISNQGGTIS